jgi:hypothetical protein
MLEATLASRSLRSCEILLGGEEHGRWHDMLGLGSIRYHAVDRSVQQLVQPKLDTSLGIDRLSQLLAHDARAMS